MSDLFTGLQPLDHEAIQEMILHESLRHAFPGPPTALLHPGLLLACLKRGFPETGKTRSIRVSESSEPSILRVVEIIGDGQGYSDTDFVTTAEAIAALLYANAVSPTEDTDNRGRRCLVINDEGEFLLHEWRHPS